MKSLPGNSRPGRTLVFGSDPETMLYANCIGASEYPGENNNGSSRSLWLRSSDDVSPGIFSANWDWFVSSDPDTYSAMDGSIPLDSRPKNWISTREALECFFGRVILDDTITDIQCNSTSHPVVDAMMDVTQRAFAFIALALSSIIIIPIYLVLLFTGQARPFVKRTYVGLSEQPIEVMSLEPSVERDCNPSTALVIASNQISRMHLRFILALWNVVRGDMALVGPPLMILDDYLQASHTLPALRLRTKVRPGVVSLSNTRVSNSWSHYDKRRSLEYSLFYIKYRTHILDTRVILRAVAIIMRDSVHSMARGVRTLWSLLVNRLYPRGLWIGSNAARFSSPAMPPASGYPLQPALIIGAGSAAAQLIRDLQKHPELGFWPITAVDDDARKIGKRLNGVPVVAPTEAISAIVKRDRVEQIIIAIPSASREDRTRISDLAQATGKPVYTIPPLQSILSGNPITELANVIPSDLLGRPVVETDPTGALSLLQGKSVLVTGAAGSIGSEVVRQAFRGQPAVIYGLDFNESDLYDLEQELKRRPSETVFVPIVGSILDRGLINHIMIDLQPNVVFHAAAYKHVPLMESYPQESLRTNILGTWIITDAAAQHGVERFVMVSSDKAVRPSSVMGASKRMAELIVREIARTRQLSACSVRFGNVLGSRGSVIPLFEKQIAQGGPITITDERMTRYFMTIPEAASLIIEAGAFGDSGVVYMLDMGEPVRIIDLAERLIRMKRLIPGKDIAINITGLRPGEKLFEELALDFEEAHTTTHPKIRILGENSQDRICDAIDAMQQLLPLIETGSPEEIRSALMNYIETVDNFSLEKQY